MKRKSKELISDEQRSQRQFTEAIVLLQQRGISLSLIPASVPYQRIVALAFRGNLGRIPSGLDLGGLINYLRDHDRLLALWALEHYPQYIRLKRCKRGRAKMFFKLPREVDMAKQYVPDLSPLGYQALEIVTGSKGAHYSIYGDNDQIHCTCPSATYRSGDCKHVRDWKSKHLDWLVRLKTTSNDQWAEYRDAPRSL